MPELKLASIILTAAAALTTLASSAEATVVKYTITGVVIGGHDSAGVFGGGDLSGDPFTAEETFNTSNTASSYANAGGSGANGGSHINGLSFSNVSLTIRNANIRFSDYTSNVSAIGGSQFNSFVQSSSGADESNIGFYVASPKILADYTDENHISGLSDLYAGYFTLNDAAGRQVVYANFEVMSLAAISSVPLPASAPMFGAALLALGVVGCRMNRKRALSIGAGSLGHATQKSVNSNVD